MGLMKQAKTAQQWAELLVQELTENLRQNWAEEFANDLSTELCEQLDEDFQEDLPPVSAKRLAERLADDLRDSLVTELQGELPQDVRKILHEDLENLVFEQLTRGSSVEDIRQVATQREEELAEKWARWVAGELTSHLLHQLADQIGTDGDSS
jgi:hypothetical protein